MKKKIVITSLILVLIPSILFSILYGIMSYVIYHGGEDYSEKSIGNWKAIQYISEKQLYPCNEERSFSLEIKENKMVISGNLLKPGEYDYKWDTGSIAKINYGDEKLIFVVSINSIDQMKITINSMNYIITLERK